VTFEPPFDAFARAYAAGQAQVVVQRLVDDLETPVSAYLKVAHGQPYSFLFESVEGGAWRGTMRVKFGPTVATFRGEARLAYPPARRGDQTCSRTARKLARVPIFASAP
jgi:anthranilate/para-aminobenzoate synthase component I